jgi:16S rRNA (cytidine1402-2'-O)-methyltransferase
MERFLFDGFAPRSAKARTDYIYSIKNEIRTIVLFEAPHRTKELVSDLLEILGSQRKVALCREMTKKYEEVFRGSLSELNRWVEQREILGEVTLVIEGAQLSEVAARTPEEIAAQVALREATGMERREAVAAVAEEFRLRKREVFDALVASKIGQ